MILLLLWSLAVGAAGERVFTVFAHGTGGHRSGWDLELVTEFGAAYWGREAEHDSGALPPRVNGFYLTTTGSVS